MKTANEYLESKIGHFNPAHPFIEKDVDYEDVVNWLQEFADAQSIEFAEWTNIKGYTFTVTGKWYLDISDLELKYITTSELLQQFK